MPGTDCTPGTCADDEATAASGCGTGGTGCVPTAANDFCAQVEGLHQQRPPAGSPTSVLGERVVRGPTGTGVLPFTGAAGLAFYGASGAAMLAVGTVVMILARRRRRTG
jgi:hypothetical protein